MSAELRVSSLQCKISRIHHNLGFLRRDLNYESRVHFCGSFLSFPPAANHSWLASTRHLSLCSCTSSFTVQPFSLSEPLCAILSYVMLVAFRGEPRLCLLLELSRCSLSHAQPHHYHFLESLRLEFLWTLRHSTVSLEHHYVT